MLVERVLSMARERLITISADALLRDAAKLLCDTQVSLVVVCNSDGAMVGVITKTDIIGQISHCQGCACTTATAAVMTQDVTYCHPSDLLHGVWLVMKERGFLHIPVIDQDFRPAGVVNARDALQALLGEVEDEELLLRDYVMGIGYR
jgi:CBS domain-containing protein